MLLEKATHQHVKDNHESDFVILNWSLSVIIIAWQAALGKFLKYQGVSS